MSPEKWGRRDSSGEGYALGNPYTDISVSEHSHTYMYKRIIYYVCTHTHVKEHPRDGHAYTSQPMPPKEGL